MNSDLRTTPPQDQPMPMTLFAGILWTGGNKAVPESDNDRERCQRALGMKNEH